MVKITGLVKLKKKVDGGWVGQAQDLFVCGFFCVFFLHVSKKSIGWVGIGPVWLIQFFSIFFSTSQDPLVWRVNLN